MLPTPVATLPQSTHPSTGPQGSTCSITPPVVVICVIVVRVTLVGISDKYHLSSIRDEGVFFRSLVCGSTRVCIFVGRKG